LHDTWCLVAVPRLCASLTRTGSPPLGDKVWSDTQIDLPEGAPARGRDIFTNRDVSTKRVSELFGALPFSVVQVSTS
jgi:hypothetical protein